MASEKNIALKDRLVSSATYYADFPSCRLRSCILLAYYSHSWICPLTSSRVLSPSGCHNPPTPRELHPSSNTFHRWGPVGLTEFSTQPWRWEWCCNHLDSRFTTSTTAFTYSGRSPVSSTSNSPRGLPPSSADRGRQIFLVSPHLPLTDSSGCCSQLLRPP